MHQNYRTQLRKSRFRRGLTLIAFGCLLVVPFDLLLNAPWTGAFIGTAFATYGGRLCAKNRKPKSILDQRRLVR